MRPLTALLLPLALASFAQAAAPELDTYSVNRLADGRVRWVCTCTAGDPDGGGWVAWYEHGGQTVQVTGGQLNNGANTVTTTLAGVPVGAICGYTLGDTYGNLIAFGASPPEDQ